MTRVWVLAALLAGCRSELAPLGHVVVFLDTDAPLARADGLLPPIDEPAPLFDRVRVDVIPSGTSEPCAACSEEFELTEERVRDGASFVVRVEDPANAPRIRARMYRFVGGFEPPAETIVEVVAGLPPQSDEGATEVTLFLPTDAVGSPSGSLDVPGATIAGRPAPSRVGSWPGAQRRGCLEAPRPGEVCVPGGAFWMNHPLAPSMDPTAFPPHPPRLVVVSPFYLDAHEATVGELRATAMPPDGVWSGSSAGTDILDWCTYTTSGEHDALPVNCIGWFTARAYCQARGADLPTEAQLEYASGGLASRLYLWGFDPASCKDAVWGRGGGGIIVEFSGECRPPADIGGPLPVTAAGEPPRSARDHLDLPTGVLTELAGNVSEWAFDAYQPLDGDCWSDSHVLVDPKCDAVSMPRTVRGGSWVLPGDFLRASSRSAYQVPSVDKGFRCARPAAPAP